MAKWAKQMYHWKLIAHPTLLTIKIEVNLAVHKTMNGEKRPLVTDESV